jgi:hypothetical protein
VTQLPTINYVTDMQERVNYVTEMRDQINTVTDYETRTIPTIQRRIRTRYETVQDFAPQDAAGAIAGGYSVGGAGGFSDASYGSAGVSLNLAQLGSSSPLGFSALNEPAAITTGSAPFSAGSAAIIGTSPTLTTNFSSVF